MHNNVNIDLSLFRLRERDIFRGHTNKSGLTLNNLLFLFALSSQIVVHKTRIHWKNGIWGTICMYLCRQPYQQWKCWRNLKFRCFGFTIANIFTVRRKKRLTNGKVSDFDIKVLLAIFRKHKFVGETLLDSRRAYETILLQHGNYLHENP